MGRGRTHKFVKRKRQTSFGDEDIGTQPKAARTDVEADTMPGVAEEGEEAGNVSTEEDGEGPSTMVSHDRSNHRRPAENAWAGNRNVLMVLSTAGGKSLAISIPARLQPPVVTIVFTPFVSLRDDLSLRFREQGIDSVVYQPNVSADKTVVFVTAEAAANSAHFFHDYLPPTTPGKATGTGGLGRDAIHDRRLANANVQRVYLTVTLPRCIEEDLRERLLVHRTTRIIRASVLQRNISFQVVIVEPERQIDYIRSQVDGQKGRKEKTIIFCLATKTATSLAKALSSHFSETSNGQAIEAYTAKNTPAEWDQMYRNFRDGKTDTVIATTCFGTGIDIPKVTLVIHYQGAYELTSLFQQAGRAGRENEPSRSIVLLSNSKSNLPQSMNDKPGRLTEDLAALHRYLVEPGCRQTFLSRYFDVGRLSPDESRCQDGDQLCDNCQMAQKQRRSSGLQVNAHASIANKVNGWQEPAPGWYGSSPSKDTSSRGSARSPELTQLPTMNLRESEFEVNAGTLQFMRRLSQESSPPLTEVAQEPKVAEGVTLSAQPASRPREQNLDRNGFEGPTRACGIFFSSSPIGRAPLNAHRPVRHFQSARSSFPDVTVVESHGSGAPGPCTPSSGDWRQRAVMSKEFGGWMICHVHPVIGRGRELGCINCFIHGDLEPKKHEFKPCNGSVDGWDREN
ncbi:hypothetical protein MMC27_003898 [Xylographa pallens]|nr:hypothetical protein [Xylographa pallens]